jgi:hypothetical protein
MELIFIIMSKCEHGEKITKFCITEHCRHKEAAGCDYCIKKYHFHLTNTALLSEEDLDGIVKTLTFASDSKYKSRSLIESTNDYLRQVKQAVNTWFDQAQSIITDKLSHPLLRKEGLLATYQRIRNRDYRKVNAKELKAISEFSKNNTL